MRVVFQSYTTCCQNESGGVQNRLRKIAALLSERGIDTELFNPFETKLHRGDILHVFMNTLDNASLIQYAKSMGVKVVISTIIPIADNNKLRVYKAIKWMPIVTTYKLNRRSLNLADALITETQEESAFICRYYSIRGNKMFVIPNGIDINDYEGEDIYERIGVKEKYVLMVGRFDANKNQLNVIKAIKGKDFHLVLIGGAEKCSSKYYEKCLKEADGEQNIHFMGWIDNRSELLQSAYAHADTVILASHFETFGLTALEGAVKGAKIVFSNTLPIRRYPAFQDCPSFNPNNVREIEAVISDCVNMKNDFRLKQEVINAFNWNTIIDQHLALYHSI